MGNSMMTESVKHYINHCEENVINLTDTDTSENEKDPKEIIQDNFDSNPNLNVP